MYGFNTKLKLSVDAELFLHGGLHIDVAQDTEAFLLQRGHDALYGGVE